jgi:RNA polymerase sigma-70 factor (ECF subfamily)
LKDASRKRPTEEATDVVTADSLFQSLEELKSGDEQSACSLHDRYANRLLGLVRQRMDPQFNGRLDPEDILQSAFRSFFRIVSDSEWKADGRAERVWSLLCAIALNKLKQRVRFHSADKRSVKREISSAADLTDDRMPEAEALIVDEMEWILVNSSELHQRILESLLQGDTAKDISLRQNCSLRTVYRVAERAIAQLKTRLEN